MKRFTAHVICSSAGVELLRSVVELDENGMITGIISLDNSSVEPAYTLFLDGIITPGIVSIREFAKKGEKDTVIYNSKIRIKNIPIEAYDYIVNGKPALEWVMERQGVSTHKDSGIVNDANDWAIETMDNPRYPLELFLRVITVSLETQKIVNNLPKLDI